MRSQATEEWTDEAMRSQATEEWTDEAMRSQATKIDRRLWMPRATDIHRT